MNDSIQTLTFNLANWSGEEVTIKYDTEKMSWTFRDMDFHLIKQKEKDPELVELLGAYSYKVMCPGEWKDPICELMMYGPDKRRDSNWLAFAYYEDEHSRQAHHPVIAATQYIANVV